MNLARMESERVELHKSLVDDIIKGMEQVEQLKVSSRQRMLASYKEALFILTGRDPRGQCHSESVISHSDPPASSSLKRKFREDRSLKITTSGQECDDGYKWRKYGTREILGSKFPRSYYRCTERGCSARKHAQRSSIDPTKFEVTYSGKHACLAGGGGLSSNERSNRTSS